MTDADASIVTKAWKHEALDLEVQSPLPDEAMLAAGYVLVDPPEEK